jgi:predicted metal-dependent peptidase
VASASEILVAARLLVTGAGDKPGIAPYFTAAVRSLIPRWAPGLGTVGVTRNGILLVDPEAIERWGVRATAGALLHEVGHLLRDHIGRSEKAGHDPHIGNLAGDLEWNDDLAAAKIKLPDGAIYPSTFKLPDGWLMEGYYRALRDMQAKARAKGGKGKKGAGAGDKGNGRGEPGDGESGDLGPDKPTCGGGWCGSGGGREVPGEPPGGGKDGRSQAEIAAVRRVTAEAIKAAASSNGIGNVPAGFLRWAETQLAPPKIPWQQKLGVLTRAAAAYRSGAVDYRFDRPSRRQAAAGGYANGAIILPALRRPIIRAAVFLDTSGSMDDSQIAEAMSETDGILRALGAEATFSACDCAVHASRPIRNWRDAIPAIMGGGGTSFVPVFEEANRMRPRPDIVICFTDGEGPAPIEAPTGYRVIWGLTGSHSRPPAPWGDVVILDDLGKKNAA